MLLESNDVIHDRREFASGKEALFSISEQPAQQQSLLSAHSVVIGMLDQHAIDNLGQTREKTGLLIGLKVACAIALVEQTCFLAEGCYLIRLLAQNSVAWVQDESKPHQRGGHLLPSFVVHHICVCATKSASSSLLCCFRTFASNIK